MKKLFIILAIGFFSCTKTGERVKVVTQDDSYLVPTKEQFHSDVADAAAESAKGANKGKPTKPPVPPPPPPPSNGVKIICANFSGMWIARDSRNDDWAWQVGDGSGFYAAPSNLTLAQQDTVLADLRASYAPYNVYITTDTNLYKASTGWKQEVIITPTTFKNTGSGTSFIGSGSYPYHPVNFVFEDQLFRYGLYVGKIATHEVGHAAGLYHQSTYNPDCTLYSTYADGAKMGAHWSTVGIWKYGTSNCCTCYQDDNSILTSTLGLK